MKKEKEIVLYIESQDLTSTENKVRKKNRTKKTSGGSLIGKILQQDLAVNVQK
jgi:uncharacterized protein YlbG (UPF0298 family)